uniref:Uncharacterized protein n=1 Tax=Anopheles dirus TaxID=7168 RepID=A0A182NWA4_9DIPT
MLFICPLFLSKNRIVDVVWNCNSDNVRSMVTKRNALNFSRS